MMIDPKKLSEAVKDLRATTTLSQNAFAAKIGKSYASVQRYEGVTPPKGQELARFVYVAREFGRHDLAKLFKAAALSGIPEELITLIREEEPNENPKKAPNEGQVHKRRLSA